MTLFRWRLWTETRELVHQSIMIVEKIIHGEFSELLLDNHRHEHVRQRPHLQITLLNTRNILWNLFRSPLQCLYYFYIWLPLFWCTFGLEFLTIILQTSSRRSTRVYILLAQISSFYHQGEVFASV
jgi:hypothetical protein